MTITARVGACRPRRAPWALPLTASCPVTVLGRLIEITVSPARCSTISNILTTALPSQIVTYNGRSKKLFFVVVAPGDRRSLLVQYCVRWGACNFECGEVGPPSKVCPIKQPTRQPCDRRAVALVRRALLPGGGARTRRIGWQYGPTPNSTQGG